jgi:chaperonin GroES
MSIPQPMFDRVLIQPFVDPEKTEGGILIPETARKKTNSGLVMAVGPGKALDEYLTNGPGKKTRMHLPMHVEVGDTVYFGEYFGHPINVDGTTYVVAVESELLAVEKPAKEE